MKLSFKIVILVLLFTAFAKAQVGIGTNDPKAALDIRATANPEESGILIPKLAAFPAGMTADQDGILVYIDGSGATSKGFYYYEEVTDTWIPIAGAAAADNQQIDVLNLNGTNIEISLQDDGVATQTLNLASLQDGRGNTLDEAYDYGGSGTGRIITSDSGAVEIQGNGGLVVEDDIIAGNAIIHDGDPDTYFQFANNGMNIHAGGRNYLNVNHATQELLVNSSGATSDFRVRSDNETHMFFIDGSENHIGIGTNSPQNPLHIGMRTTFDTAVANSGQDGLFIRGSGTTGIDEIGGSISFGGAHPARDNSRRAAIASVQSGIDEDNVGLSFYVHRGPINTEPMVEGMRLTHRRYLGINNTNPSATLDVIGTLQFEDGNEAAGRVLTSDASGNATWQSLVVDDNQQIDVLNLNGTDLEISLQDDGVATQTVNLASIQESTTANNGLTLNTGTVQLGGALIQNTAITQGTNSLDINLNSTGDFAIQDNGSDVFFVEDSGEIGIGTNVPVYPLHMVETGPYNNGFFMTKIETSSSETAGMRIEKEGLGTGRSHAIFTNVSGSGTGQKYGLFNRITATSTGTQYGTRNFLSGTTTAWQFGTFNNLDNAGTGNRYGVYNGMRNANAANLYGVYNEFERNYSAADDIVGVRNRFTGGTPGTEGMNGIWTDFTTATNGNYYGNRTEFSAAATGTGNKYGTYNLISASAGGTHYGTYNSVNINDGWASYDLGKSYISERLSIGEPDNAAGRINILNNSGGSNPAHIQLTETSANDGPRLQFANAVETTNEWTLFGRADDNLADSSFNFFHTTTGNILEIKGDGEVEINGQLGLNLNNPTYAVHLPNSTTIGTGRGQANAWVTYSDRRIKSNFTDISSGTNLVMSLNPQRYFQHNSSFADSKLSIHTEGEETIGFIAQELYKILPEAVHKPSNENEELWAVNYEKIIPVAVKAIQEQQQTIEELQKEIEALKLKNERLSNLEKRIEALEKK